MSYLLIILLTIYVSTRSNLMYENITGVASLPQYRFLVIMYISGLALFFAYKMTQLYNTLPVSNKYKSIILLTAIIMIVGAFSPYSLNGTDFYSKAHVYCSMTGCILFLILLWIFTRYLSLYKTDIYIKIHWYYDLGLQFLMIFTLVMTRINGIIEILYAILVCGYLFMIENSFRLTHNKYI